MTLTYRLLCYRLIAPEIRRREEILSHRDANEDMMIAPANCQSIDPPHGRPTGLGFALVILFRRAASPLGCGVFLSLRNVYKEPNYV
jgi:hypothetical protein